MKMVQALLPRGLCAAAIVMLAACSGTKQAESTNEPAPTGAEVDLGSSPAKPDGKMAQEPKSGQQAPGQQGPGGVAAQRRNLLVSKSIEEARRSLDLKLYSDAADVAAEVLEIDPGNREARQILQAAQAAMGKGKVGVEREFIDRVRQSQVAHQKLLYDVRREMNLGDAEREQNHLADAIDHYEKGLLLLRYSPMLQPGSDLERLLQTKLDDTKQAKVKADRERQEARVAASKQQLEAQERRARIQRQTRVKRLLEQANYDFQLANYREAVQLLDQALREEPNNANALALRTLSERARHENRMDVLRHEWNAEWSRTFDDLNSLDVPQTEPVKYDLERWREVERRKPLQFTPPEDLETPEERAILAKLANTKLEHRFATATVDEWANYYATVTDVTFVVTAGVKNDLDAETTTLKDFSLPLMSVEKALDIIGNVTGVKWKVENGVVKLVTPDKAGGKVYLVQYEVRDIVQGVRNRPGPELKLRAPGDEDTFGFEEEEEPAPTIVDADKLVDLIRSTIAPDTWDEGGRSINPQRGVLLVRHNRQVHARIERLLADLRQAVGIQVDVETRFLQVEDQFLEDIGVDFRGLGNQAASGLPGRGLEKNNRQNAGFDDFGRRNLINPATPGEIGTGTEPGFFYDNGNDGDILARTENLFDRTLGGNGTLENSGGLALQYAYLDDSELEVVLRAVAKQQRSELITAPRLLVYNNTRASMSVLRHTSFIRDFDVEIAQSAAVANPIIDVVKDGVVLDVRPVVSADRRFITMELRPTVMTLQLPIPTFVTTLGVGQPVSIQLPRVTLQRVRTTVTMPDGGTLMLGGMKLAQKQYQVSEVPILGQLPILSLLFSRKGTFIQNKKILILIKATIVIPSEHVPELGPDDYTSTLLSDK